MLVIKRDPQIYRPISIVFALACFLIIFEAKATILGASLPQQTDLLTGYADLINLPKDKQSSFNSYEVILQKEMFDYTVALCLQQINGYFDPRQLYYVLTVSKKQTVYFETIVKMSFSASWNFVRINYIVTSHKNIQLGSFIVGNPIYLSTQKQSNGKDKFLQKYSSVINPLFSSKNLGSFSYVSYVFIVGIRTDQRNINLKIVGQHFTGSQLFVVYEISNAVSHPQILSFSYFIYKIERAGRIVYGMVNIQNKLFENSLAQKDRKNVLLGVTELCGECERQNAQNLRFKPEVFDRFFKVKGLIIRDSPIHIL